MRSRASQRHAKLGHVSERKLKAHADFLADRRAGRPTVRDGDNQSLSLDSFSDEGAE
jgi:hypothetical protein